MKNLTQLLLALSLAISIPVHAEVAQQVLDDAYENYLTAVDGGKKASKETAKLFEQLNKDYPGEPGILVLYGGSQTLQGRDAWAPWKKLKFTENGLDRMEKAVALLETSHREQVLGDLPLDLQVKTLTGITYVSVPDFFNRFDQGRQLLGEVVNDQRLADMPDQAYQYILLYAGQAAEKDGDVEQAKQLYQRIIDGHGLTEEAEKAKAALANLS